VLRQRVIHFYCPKCQNSGYDDTAEDGYCSCIIGQDQQNRWARPLAPRREEPRKSRPAKRWNGPWWSDAHKIMC
jgi:hypothetical protein